MSKICQSLRRLLSPEVQNLIEQANFSEDERAVFDGLLANRSDVRIMMDTYMSGNRYYNVKRIVKEKVFLLIPSILEQRKSK